MGQTYRDIQVVVVDDGSTDETPGVCAEWAARDSRISVFRQENRGLPAARNAGLRAAQGKWVWFVDADDELVPLAVEAVVAGCGGADIVSLGYLTVSEAGRVLARRTPPLRAPGDESDLIREVALRSMSDYIWSFVFRRESLAAVGDAAGPFVEGYALFEDTVSLQAILRGGRYRVVFLHEFLYRYRQRGSSMTRREDPSMARSGLRAIRNLAGCAYEGDLRDCWLAKLSALLLFSVDGLAGPGLGDGQGELHREIEAEGRALLERGGASGRCPRRRRPSSRSSICVSIDF